MKYVKKETIDKLIERQQHSGNFVRARYQGFGYDDQCAAFITTKNKEYLLINRYDKGYEILKTYNRKK